MTAATASSADTTTGSTAVAPAWRRLCAIALVVSAVGDMAVQLLARTVIPPLLVFAFLSLVSAGLLRRPGRAGPIAALVVATLALLAGVPFVQGALAHPESPIDFLHGITSMVFRLTAAGAAIATLRHWSPAAARSTSMGLAAVSALAVIATLAATLLGGSDAALAGDVTVQARNATWGPQTLSVDAGNGVLVDNADGFRHTFSVRDTDLSVELPAWQSKRVAVDLAPGSYELFCAVPGHEAMTGTLEVR